MIISRNIGIMGFFVDAKDEKQESITSNLDSFQCRIIGSSFSWLSTVYNRRIKQFPKGRLAHCIDFLPLNQNLKLLGRSIILLVTKFL